MNNEEKILELLEKLNGTVEKHGEMLEKLNGTVEKHGEMLEKLNGTVEKHGEMLEKLNGTVEKHGETLTKMQGDLTHIKARLDYDVDKRFDAINEGIDAILAKLGTLDEVKELAEETRDKVDVIHAVVSQHSAAITELKQVQ